MVLASFITDHVFAMSDQGSKRACKLPPAIKNTFNLEEKSMAAFSELRYEVETNPASVALWEVWLEWQNEVVVEKGDDYAEAAV